MPTEDPPEHPVHALSMRYQALSRAAQIKCLVSFGFELTTVARDGQGGHSGEPVDGTLLQTINEIQHRVLRQARKLLAGEKSRYPDGVLVGILLTHRSAFIANAAMLAFEKALADAQ